MKVDYSSNGKNFNCDLSRGIDLSSTLGGEHHYARAWGVPPVKIEPVQGDGWTGSVEAGAPINFYNIAFNPHGNGTHTECVGHITPEHHKLDEVLKKFHFRAYFVNLEPEKRGTDEIITWKSLNEKIPDWDFEALIVAVPTAWPIDFTGSNPVYFEPELLANIRERGVMHFITNLPSVDREEDGGKLLAHKAFWNYPEKLDLNRTITELANLQRNIADGYYLLNLQVAHFNNDACPSRPVIYPLTD